MDKLKLTASFGCVVLGLWGYYAFPDTALVLRVLMVVGGLLYTLGVVFYLWRRLPFHYTIWHVFVLAASLVFYAAVTLHLVQTA